MSSQRSYSGDEWALLVVDVQPRFVACVQSTYPEFEKNVGELLDWARKQSMKIVHVRAHYRDEKSLWLPIYRQWRESEDPGRGAITPEPSDVAVELNDEHVVIKHTFDGFFETELEATLRRLGVKKVLVSGILTSCCVFSTAQGAVFRGFEPVLVEDCCADRTIADHQDAIRLGLRRSFIVAQMSDLRS